MKNFILSTVITLSFSNYFTQCIPDSIYADSTFGVWPTPQTNFPPGDVGIPYYEVVNFKIPRDAGAIDSAAAGTYIDSIVLTSISNIVQSSSSISLISFSNLAGVLILFCAFLTSGNPSITSTSISNIIVRWFNDTSSESV